MTGQTNHPETLRRLGPGVWFNEEEAAAVLDMTTFEFRRLLDRTRCLSGHDGWCWPASVSTKFIGRRVYFEKVIMDDLRALFALVLLGRTAP